jgi:hypothetical protein
MHLDGAKENSSHEWGGNMILKQRFYKAICLWIVFE